MPYHIAQKKRTLYFPPKPPIGPGVYHPLSAIFQSMNDSPKYIGHSEVREAILNFESGKYSVVHIGYSLKYHFGPSMIKIGPTEQMLYSEMSQPIGWPRQPSWISDWCQLQLDIYIGYPTSTISTMYDQNWVNKTEVISGYASAKQRPSWTSDWCKRTKP